MQHPISRRKSDVLYRVVTSLNWAYINQSNPKLNNSSAGEDFAACLCPWVQRLAVLGSLRHDAIVNCLTRPGTEATTAPRSECDEKRLITLSCTAAAAQRHRLSFYLYVLVQFRPPATVADVRSAIFVPVSVPVIVNDLPVIARAGNAIVCYLSVRPSVRPVTLSVDLEK